MENVSKVKKNCSMFSPCALSLEKKIASMRISFARDYIEKHYEKTMIEEYGDDDFLSIYSMLLIQEEIRKKLLTKQNKLKTTKFLVVFLCNFTT